MNERQKRLIEVYDYVRQHFGIHTKQGFSEALNYGRTICRLLSMVMKAI